MALKQMYLGAPLKWRIFLVNVLLASLTLLVVAGAQITLRHLVSMSNHSYVSIKATKLTGRFFAGLSNLTGEMARIDELVKAKTVISTDDLEIAIDQVRSVTLDLSGDIATVGVLKDDAAKIDANLKSTRASLEQYFAALKSKSNSADASSAALKALSELESNVKDVEQKLADGASEAFNLVCKIEKYTAYSAIFLLLIIGLSLFFSYTMSRNVIERFNSVMNEVKSVTTNLSTESANLVRQSSVLSSGATEGAAALQETVATLEEISEMAARTTERINQSTNASTENLSTAEHGRTKADQASKGMHSMQRSIQSFSNEVIDQTERLNEVVKIIGEIAGKTKIINDIVFQTKMLSFNASIESARAGEHGRGFAVVAEEIGNLATMSGSASKEIGMLVESSVEAVTTLVDGSKKKIQDLSANANRETVDASQRMEASSTSLASITEGARTVCDLNQEILAAAHEQAQGIRNISTAMNQLNMTISSNANSAANSADVALKFEKLAAVLNENIAGLEVEIFGNKNRSKSLEPLKTTLPVASEESDDSNILTSNVVEFPPAQTIQSNPIDKASGD